MINARSRMLAILFLLLTAIVVNGAATGSILTGLLLKKLHEFRTSSVAKRQGSNGSGISLDEFPQQCQPGCQVAVNAMNTCSLPSCLCTTAVDSSLNDCINCTVEVLPDPTIIQDGQKVFDTYNALCAGTGVNVLSFSGTVLSGTATDLATSSVPNPFLTNSVPLGPTTTISLAAGGTSDSTVPSATATKFPGSLKGNDAVALPRASKAYVAASLVVAFFMCLA